MARDKPILIQTLDTDTEQWTDLWNLHANVNTITSGEGYSAGSERTRLSLRFRLVWFPALSGMRYRLQEYRIIYEGSNFNIVAYDDYQERHIEAVLDGELYG